MSDVPETSEEWAADLLGIPREEVPLAEFSPYQRERIACVLLGARAIEAAVREQPKPIDMVLHCPRCGTQHVDADESEELTMDGTPWNTVRVGWNNPPHRSHLCHGCGFIWRPADVPTNGVAAIKTKGKNDSAPQQGDSAVASEGGSCVSALDGEALARRFHETYERLAPSFGYETRADTRAFDAASPNGRLMVAVCSEIASALSTAGAQRGASEQDETTAYEPLDSLDWERLKGGAFRALDPSHQWAFDVLRLAKEQR